MMSASSPAPGTWFGVQSEAVLQSPPLLLFQVIVAITFSILDARDVTDGDHAADQKLPETEALARSANSKSHHCQRERESSVKKIVKSERESAPLQLGLLRGEIRRARSCGEEDGTAHWAVTKKTAI